MTYYFRVRITIETNENPNSKRKAAKFILNPFKTFGYEKDLLYN